MKTVSIFLILLTVTVTSIQLDEIKDLLMTLSVFMFFYLFGFCLSRKINRYIRRKRLERDFANIFTDKFLLKILRNKNELKEISRSNLCAVESKQIDSEKQSF